MLRWSGVAAAARGVPRRGNNHRYLVSLRQPPLQQHAVGLQSRNFLFVPTSWRELQLRCLREATPESSRTVKVKLWNHQDAFAANASTTATATTTTTWEGQAQHYWQCTRLAYERTKLLARKQWRLEKDRGNELLKRSRHKLVKTWKKRHGLLKPWKHNHHHHRWTMLPIKGPASKALFKTGRKLRDRSMEWFGVQRKFLLRRRNHYLPMLKKQQQQMQDYAALRLKRVHALLQQQRGNHHAKTANSSDAANAAARVIIPVHIPEYSQASWFDAAGRPIASRDETGRFVNPWMSQSTDGVQTLGKLLRWRFGCWQRQWEQHGFAGLLLQPQAAAAAEQIQPLNDAKNHLTAESFLTDPTALTCTWIGHATCLVQKDKVKILTDPMFSHRASALSFVGGVTRDVPPACQIADLPESLDVCLISHDHYDHLDLTSVVQLRDRVQLWVVPVGIGAWLHQCADIANDRIVELSWWDSVLLQRPNDTVDWAVAERQSLHHPQEGDKTAVLDQRHPSFETAATPNQFWITAYPAQHWSTRNLLDRCHRLWASFGVFLSDDQVFYFAGDTGRPQHFPLWEQVSNHMGRPVDLAALPIGAYAPSVLNQEAHVNPEEAVEMHQRLQCRQSMAIHHSSFPQLSEEPPHEPAEWLQRAAAKANVHFRAVPLGGSVSVGPN